MYSTTIKNIEINQVMVAQAFSPSTWEAEAGESKQVQDMQGSVTRETLS